MLASQISGCFSMPIVQQSRFEGLVDHRFCDAALQKLREFLGNYGAAKKVSLLLTAAFLFQKVQLLLGLYALSHHVMLGALTDASQSAQHHDIVGVRGNVVYEAAGNFQGIRWKFS